MGRTAYTEPQYLYKGALYLYLYLIGDTQPPTGESVYQRQRWKTPFCVEVAYSIRVSLATTLIPRMRGSRLLRHGTALYCRNTTVCTVESAHTTGASTQQHCTY